MGNRGELKMDELTSLKMHNEGLQAELEQCKSRLALASAGRCPTCESKSEEIRDILHSVGMSRATAPVDGVRILAQMVNKSRELLNSLQSVVKNYESLYGYKL